MVTNVDHPYCCPVPKFRVNLPLRSGFYFPRCRLSSVCCSQTQTLDLPIVCHVSYRMHNVVGNPTRRSLAVPTFGSLAPSGRVRSLRLANKTLRELPVPRICRRCWKVTLMHMWASVSMQCRQITWNAASTKGRTNHEERLDKRWFYPLPGVC